MLPAVASKMVAPGRSVPALFRLGNHAQCSAVLDAPARVQVLELGVDVGGIGRDQLSQVKDGGFADQFRDFLGDASGAPGARVVGAMGWLERCHFSSLHKYFERNSSRVREAERDGQCMVTCRWISCH